MNLWCQLRKMNGQFSILHRYRRTRERVGVVRSVSKRGLQVVRRSVGICFVGIALSGGGERRYVVHEFSSSVRVEINRTLFFKAECPLCRQSLNLTRLLPIYNL